MCLSNGTCSCTLGWATCNTAFPCLTNVSNDPLNCGGCNKLCQPGPGMQSAVCSNSQCEVVCNSGYTLCDDNTCAAGDNCPLPPLPGCQLYTDNQCDGNVIITPPDYVDRWFQTPAPGSPNYRASYQSYYTLQGHLQVVYNAARTAATVTVVTIQKVNVTLTFTYNGVQSSNPVSQYSASSLDGYTQLNDSLYVTVSGADGSSLVLDPIDFIWTNPAINQPSGDYRSGAKGAIVELFGWQHTDIEQECEFISQAGYLGVKVYPTMEQVMSDETFQVSFSDRYISTYSLL